VHALKSLLSLISIVLGVLPLVKEDEAHVPSFRIELRLLVQPNPRALLTAAEAPIISISISHSTPNYMLSTRTTLQQPW
jgi:hypothetical protein